MAKKLIKKIKSNFCDFLINFSLQLNLPILTAFGFWLAAKQINNQGDYTVVCIGRSIFMDDVRAMVRFSGQIRYFDIQLRYFCKIFDYFVSSNEQDLYKENKYHLCSYQDYSGKKKYHDYLAIMIPWLRRLLKFDAVLSGNFGYTAQQEIAQVSQEQKIPFIVIHKEAMGAFGDCMDVYDNLKLVADKILLYNNKILESFLRIKLPGITINNAKVVGIPRLDHYFNLESKKEKKQLVFFSCYPQRDPFISLIKEEEKVKEVKKRYANFHRSIMNFARNHPELKVIIKTKNSKHFIDYVKEIFNQNFKEKIENLIITNIGSVTKLIEESDAVIAFNSTTLVEALIAGKMIISPDYDFDYFARNRDWDFFAHYPQLINWVKDETDLERCFFSQEKFQNPDESAKRLFLTEIISTPDGRASERAEAEIIKTIKQFSSENNLKIGQDKKNEDSSKHNVFIAHQTAENSELKIELDKFIDEKMSSGEERNIPEIEEIYKAFKKALGREISSAVNNTEEAEFSFSPQEFHWLSKHSRQDWFDYLIYRYRFKTYPPRQKLLDFPLYLLIEPTSICNLRCLMCFQADKSFQTKEYLGIMPWNLFVKVADQAKEMNCQAITLASRGEPTLHPEFGKMLYYLKKIGILDIKINTNATKLNEKISHEILSAGVSEVVFSMDAADESLYRKIRPGGDFQSVVANIKKFHRIRKNYYPQAATTTRITGVKFLPEQNISEIDGFWRDIVDEITIKRAAERWDSYHNKKVNWAKPCYALWERMYVWHDGTVNPCDFDYKSKLAVGNAYSKPLKDIWKGQTYSRLRKLHLEGRRSELIPCDRCSIT